jgi:hypothetical protein
MIPVAIRRIRILEKMPFDLHDWFIQKPFVILAVFTTFHRELGIYVDLLEKKYYIHSMIKSNKLPFKKEEDKIKQTKPPRIQICNLFLFLIFV